MSKSLQRWFENKTSNPFREIAKAEEAFERILEEMKNNRISGSEMEFSPSCDIEEDGNKYLMKFDLPGVKKDQVKVEIDGDRLTVRAERKEEKKSETKKKYLSEVSYGSYVRTFTMPGPIEEKSIDAKFEDGVLTVSVPKTGEQKASKLIPIH